MNDYLLIACYIVVIVVFIVGMIVAKVSYDLKYLSIGFCSAWTLLILTAGVVSPLVQNEYEKMPYLDEPTIYELSENDMQNIFQTGKANSITFFDSNGYAHTIVYSELSRQYEENAVPSVLVYCREKSTKWMFRTNIPKIVILMPET